MEIEHIRNKRAFICDMDGVIYHGNHLLPGAAEFVAFLKEQQKQFLFLTNSSERSPRELSEKLARLGIKVDESHFYTSALSTAAFLASQKPGGSAYVIGEAGLIQALYEVGFSMNNVDPDYVVIGETRSYNFEKIEDAVALLRKGAKLIGTNPDMTGPTERGIVPATGALVAPIEMAAGCKAYFLGKPNPLMMRIALKKLKTAPEDTVIVGDRMDTDIISGIESELETVLVFSGVTAPEELKQFGYAPTFALPGVGAIARL
ncbi:MAG: HAD family hydrolase [Oligosphaeraceae bacterium]|nr:HAD family hydrolase [Oligosphaeraceae bacterium]